jgi:alcohol dehydrogenase class IV
MNFEFCTSGRILFGCGVFHKTGAAAAALGREYLVVAGGASVRASGALDRLLAQLKAEGLGAAVFQGVTGEPAPEMVEAAVCAAPQHCDGVIALGGGSVIDTAKAAAALLTNGGALVDYLEGVGTGKKLTADPLPVIAIPTTAGTGSEATKNAVISSEVQRFKKSIRHEKMIPAAAIVDPELTLTLPPDQTAYSGMDALTQLIEAYVTKKANPMTDALCLKGIRMAAASLKRAYDDGQDLQAREGMALAALFSGICLANAGLGAAHGIAAALGCFYGVPHGKACAVLLPHVMAENQSAALGRFSDIGCALTGRDWGDEGLNGRAAIDGVRALNANLGIPETLKDVPFHFADLPALAEASQGNSLRGNPKVFSQDELIRLIRRVLPGGSGT